MLALLHGFGDSIFSLHELIAIIPYWLSHIGRVAAFDRPDVRLSKRINLGNTWLVNSYHVDGVVE